MADRSVLTGERAVLRAPRLDDADVLFERIASDPEVTRYLSWSPHPNVAETRRVITELFNVGDEQTWLIELPDSGPVGLCGWRRPQPHSIEFGYCLGRRWWRQGIMSEVLPLLTRAGAKRSRACTGCTRTATSTTSGRRGCSNAAGWRWKAGWCATACFRTSAPSRKTA